MWKLLLVAQAISLLATTTAAHDKKDKKSHEKSHEKHSSAHEKDSSPHTEKSDPDTDSAETSGYQKYMKEFASDYSKYMNQGGASSSQGGDYQKYMDQYSSDYS
eukprot:4561761-Amphidinium_carterae.1